MPLKSVRKQGQKPFFPDYSLFTAAEVCIPKALRAVLSAAAADYLKRPGEAMSLPGLFTPVAARCPQAPLRIWTIKNGGAVRLQRNARKRQTGSARAVGPANSYGCFFQNFLNFIKKFA